MTLDKDNKKRRWARERAPQTRTQKIVQWSIYGVAAVLLIIAITLLIVNHVRIF